MLPAARRYRRWISNCSNYLDPNRPDPLRLTVRDVRALGEAALGRSKDQSDAGDHYRTRMPDCHFMVVYDAGRAICRVAGSLGCFHAEFRQSDEVVGGHSEDELLIHLGQSSVLHLAHAGDGLGPAKGFLGPLGDSDRDLIAGMTGGSTVDCHDKSRLCRRRA
jgi:hypothetical protein